MSIQTKNVTRTIFYRTTAKGTKAFVEIEALLADGKLTEEQVERGENDAGSPTLKRKPVQATIEVPDLASYLGDAPDAQREHMQAVMERYCTDKYKELVCDPVAPESAYSVEELLAQPYTERTASVKVTKEEYEEAVTSIVPYLENTTKAAKVIAEMASKRFSVSATRVLSDAEAVRRVIAIIEETISQAVDDDEELADRHGASYQLMLDNLEKLIKQENSALSADDF